MGVRELSTWVVSHMISNHDSKPRCPPHFSLLFFLLLFPIVGSQIFHRWLLTDYDRWGRVGWMPFTNEKNWGRSCVYHSYHSSWLMNRCFFSGSKKAEVSKRDRVLYYFVPALSNYRLPTKQCKQGNTYDVQYYMVMGNWSNSRSRTNMWYVIGWWLCEGYYTTSLWKQS